MDQKELKSIRDTLVISVCGLDICAVKILCVSCDVILLTMLKHSAIERRTNTWSDNHTHRKHDTYPCGHESVRHSLIGYRGDERIEEHHARGTNDNRPFHALIHSVILHFEIHEDGVCSYKHEAQSVHPFEMHIHASGYYGEDQAHCVAHHHPVAKRSILPVVYLHSESSKHIDKHRTGITYHQKEEKQNSIIYHPYTKSFDKEIW